MELSAAYAAFFNGGLRVVPYGSSVMPVDAEPGGAGRAGGGDRPRQGGDDGADAGRGGLARDRAGRRGGGANGGGQDRHDAGLSRRVVCRLIDGEIIGVWLGNDNDAPMKAVQGGIVPARLFHEIAVGVR